MQTMQYKDVPNGKCFRLVEPEVLYFNKEHQKRVAVMDAGVFVKIGNSHAVRIQAGMSRKTIIPGRSVKCVVLPGKIDTSYLPDWALVNQPYTEYKGE